MFRLCLCIVVVVASMPKDWKGIPAVAGGCCVGGRGNCTGAGARRPTLLLKASMHCCCSDRFIAYSAAQLAYRALHVCQWFQVQNSECVHCSVLETASAMALNTSGVNTIGEHN